MKLKGLWIAIILAAAPAWATPVNQPPPAGAILDLAATQIPGGGNNTFHTYFVNFTATLSNTAITFAFRDDPAFISIESASLTDQTTPSGNLLINGDFSGGNYTDNGNSATPNGWTYANIYGATDGGSVSTNCPDGGTTSCWYDGAVQAYDAISQTVATTAGNLYQISFSLAESSNCSTNGGAPCYFSDLSTNGDVTDTGGNGIDALVYAQANLPAPGTVPEPSTLSLMVLGIIGGLAGIKFRKKV